MRRFARWHIWLGWLTGVPLVMWCVTGLFMIARPIEEVRGEHLRRELAPAPLPANITAVPLPVDPARPAVSVATGIELGRVVTRVTYADDSVARFDTAGRPLGSFTEAEARALVAERIVGGGQVASVVPTDADAPPIDLRRPIAAWQVTLADGTRVYVGRDSGEIAAVRTRWWRVFDVMWGLHIMDLETREDVHHPVLVGFATLALLGSILGVMLLFRRRRARAQA